MNNQICEIRINRHVFDYLCHQLDRMAKEQNLSSVHFLTKDFHVWPDLHGNRSPIADPTIKGMICGLTMSATVDNLALTYLGFVQALSVSRLSHYIQKVQALAVSEFNHRT